MTKDEELELEELKKEAQRIRNRKHWLKNKDKLKAERKRKKVENAEYQKEYQTKNKEKLKAKRKVKLEASKDG